MAAVQGSQQQQLAMPGGNGIMTTRVATQQQHGVATLNQQVSFSQPMLVNSSQVTATSPQANQAKVIRSQQQPQQAVQIPIMKQPGPPLPSITTIAPPVGQNFGNQGQVMSQ